MQHFGPAQMMGQMPLHINGQFRCSGEGEIHGVKFKDAHTVLSQL